MAGREWQAARTSRTILDVSLVACSLYAHDIGRALFVASPSFYHDTQLIRAVFRPGSGHFGLLHSKDAWSDARHTSRLHELMVNQPAALTLVNADGETPLKLAADAKHELLVEALHGGLPESLPALLVHSAGEEGRGVGTGPGPGTCTGSTQ